MVKQKLMSSILNEKLVFENKKYRTPKFNEAIAIITKNFQELQGTKIKKEDNLSKISLSVPLTVLFSEQFLSDLELIWNLKKTINIDEY